MADPFAAGLAALHGGPASVAAVYTAPDGAAVPIRIVWAQDSVTDGGRVGRRVADTNEFVIQRADVALPAKGATVAIGAAVYRINGAPMLDVEGLSWTCPAQPAT